MENETTGYGGIPTRKPNKARIILYILMLLILIGGYLGVKDYLKFRNQVLVDTQNIKTLADFFNQSVLATQQFSQEIQRQIQGLTIKEATSTKH